MIKQLLAPRSDVLEGKIQGVIDLEKFLNPSQKSKSSSLEQEAARFLEATYLTGEMRLLIEAIALRLNSSGAETGTFLTEGSKGLGKSHALLTVLHLLESSDKLAGWFIANRVKFSVPENFVVVSRKFTDFPIDSLWGLIAEKIGANFPKETHPDIGEFRSALEGKKLVLVFDELESGIRGITNDAWRRQNINFLQMVSEEAGREDSNVVLIGSIYDGQQEPGLTLKRGKPIEIRFSDPNERRRILFHRLFEKSPLDDNAEIETTIQSYLNTWRRFKIEIPAGYEDKLRACYPFTPELLEVVFVRIPHSSGGFQGTRGTLGFLAALVRARCASSNLITLADASIASPELRSWLADLEPSQQRIRCAESNFDDLKSEPFAERIVSAVLIASLAPAARENGITQAELARQIIDPDSDYNEFARAVNAFKRYGSYFHEGDGGGLFFDTKENAHSKVELRSISVDEGDAWEEIAKWWKQEVFKDDVVIFDKIESARRQLEMMPNDHVKLVVAPRKLKPDERHGLYFGLRSRNTVILVEPKEDHTNLRTNKDLLKYGQRALAAEALGTSASDANARNEFAKISGEEKTHATNSLKKANLVYVQIDKFGETAGDCEFQFENLPQGKSKSEILDHLRRTIYPQTLLEEHLADRAEDLFGKKVSQVEDEYRRALTFPVILSASSFREAIENLVAEGTSLSIHPPGKEAICGRRPHLGTDEFFNAELGQPVETPPADPQPRPVPTMPGGGRPTAPLPSPNPFGGGDPLPTFPTGGALGEELSTSFENSKSEIRQRVAQLFDEHSERRISEVVIDITYDARQCDMSELPSLVRGTLQGHGRFHGEAALRFDGSFSKADIEDMMERLPDFSPGGCRVKIMLAPQTADSELQAQDA